MPKIKKITTKNVDLLEADYNKEGQLSNSIGLYIIVDFGSKAVLGVANMPAIIYIYPYKGETLENDWVEYTKENRLA